MQPSGKPDVQRFYGARCTRRFQAAPIAYLGKKNQNITSQNPKIPCIFPHMPTEGAETHCPAGGPGAASSSQHGDSPMAWALPLKDRAEHSLEKPL